MGKLYTKYLQLKKENAEIAYAFKVGIFYIFLDEDAEFISTKLGLKLTHLNDTVLKCGFPISKLSKYTELLTLENINFKLVDNTLSVVNNTNEYVNHSEAYNIIEIIKKLNMETTTPIQAFNILLDLQKKLEKNGVTYE